MEGLALSERQRAVATRGSLDSSARCSELGRRAARGVRSADITPEVAPDKRAVWMAGYGFGRKAEGIHDRLFARAIVLASGDDLIAFASVDLIGLQLEVVQRIRAELKEFRHVTVGSTHNHEGPDVIGIWGPTPLQRGVDEKYLALVVQQTVAAIRAGQKNLATATAAYGTAEDETLLSDSRKPVVKDGVLRVLKFSGGDKKLSGLLVQWNCHPEAMGARNKQITADFPAFTIAWLQEKYACPVVYMSGAIGGLMGPPDGRIKSDEGKLLAEGDFEYARQLGVETAKLAGRAVESAEPIELAPFRVAEKQVALPIENKIYRWARQLNVLKREGRLWAGSADKLGQVVTEAKVGAELAIVTEVSCLQLGELTIVNVPGELYPELIYGKFEEPADPATDFPEAELEPTVLSFLPAKKWMLLGLASDEVGYIIPKRQWDSVRPYCYGRPKSQYGEINSCGPETAPILMKVLAECATELK